MLGGQRQSSGTLGKTANCQLGVSVNAVCEQASCPLNWRLFLVLRVRPAGVPRAARHEQTGAELPLHWLLVECPRVSPRPSSTGCPPCPRLRRWSSWSARPGCGWSEQDYRELKGALGLDHFEGRGFGGWLRPTGGHQRRPDRRHAASRVPVVQRPSHSAMLHPSHGEPETDRSGKRVGSSPRCGRGHPEGGGLIVQ
jgi:hypothetical protein